MTDDTVIRVEHVSKDFVLPHEKVTSIKSAFTGMFSRSRTKESQHALKDISFEIKKGEFFGIVGRNGSGKSTMLKILAGIYQPTKGSVETRGKLVPFIELGVGFNPELTGRENVYLNGAMLGFSRKEVSRMYDDIVAFAELEKFMDQKLKNYSSGMQVRLAFSMATRSEADILLIDEVLAVGDADFQRKCFDYFKELKRDKKTVVFVSHDMSAIREYCDSAVLIEQSELKLRGSADEVSAEYTRLFLDQTDHKAKQGDRWGDESIKTKHIAVKVNDDTLTITQTFEAQADQASVIAGFRIRNAAGQEVTGTNTKFERIKIPALKAGDIKTLTWSMPNCLSDGKYVVDPAILHQDGVRVLEWWDAAAHFEIKKDRRLPYILDPSFNLKIQ